jgi:hypothetical protein
MSNYLCLLLSTLVKKNYLFDLYTITYSIIGKWLYFWSIRGADKKVKGLYLYSVTLFALYLQWIKPTGQKQKPKRSMNE